MSFLSRSTQVEIEVQLLQTMQRNKKFLRSYNFSFFNFANCFIVERPRPATSGKQQSGTDGIEAGSGGNNKEICHSSECFFFLSLSLPPHDVRCSTWHPLKKLSGQIYAQFYHKSRTTLVSSLRAGKICHFKEAPPRKQAQKRERRGKRETKLLLIAIG